MQLQYLVPQKRQPGMYMCCTIKSILKKILKFNIHVHVHILVYCTCMYMYFILSLILSLCLCLSTLLPSPSLPSPSLPLSLPPFFPLSPPFPLSLSLSLLSRLPSAVIYSLLSSLIKFYPLPSSISSSSLSDVSSGLAPSPPPPLSVTAHILYHLWIIRFSSNCDLLSPPQGLLWEGTCANLEAIKQLVRCCTLYRCILLRVILKLYM